MRSGLSFTHKRRFRSPKPKSFEKVLKSGTIRKRRLIVFVWTAKTMAPHLHGASFLRMLSRQVVTFSNRYCVYVWTGGQVKTISKTVVWTKNIWYVFIWKRIRVDGTQMYRLKTYLVKNIHRVKTFENTRILDKSSDRGHILNVVYKVVKISKQMETPWRQELTWADCGVLVQGALELWTCYFLLYGYKIVQLLFMRETLGLQWICHAELHTKWIDPKDLKNNRQKCITAMILNLFLDECPPASYGNLLTPPITW